MRVPELSYGVVCMIPHLAVLIQYEHVTDGRTDRQTDSHTTTAYTALALHGKNVRKQRRCSSVRYLRQLTRLKSLRCHSLQVHHHHHHPHHRRPLVPGRCGRSRRGTEGRPASQTPSVGTRPGSSLRS